MTYQLVLQISVNVEHCRRSCLVRWCQLRVSTCQQQSSCQNPSVWDLMDPSQATTGATASASAARLEVPELWFLKAGSGFNLPLFGWYQMCKAMKESVFLGSLMTMLELHRLLLARLRHWPLRA